MGVDVMQMVGIGIVGALLMLTLRDIHPGMALMVSLTGGALIAVTLIGKLAGVVAVMGNLAARAQLTDGYLDTMVRVIGVGYLSEFGAQVCRDAGAGGIAAKVELGGKLIILAMAAPVVVALVEMIVSVLR